MDIDPKLYHMLLETFRGELFEQHQLMVDTLLSLENTESEKKTAELLSHLFRISHNLKGASKSVDKHEIAALAHQLEDLFSVWREKNERPTKIQIDQCLKLADNMIDVFNTSDKSASTSASSNHEMLNIPLHRVERVNSKINELAIFQLRLSRWVKDMSHAVSMLNQVTDGEAEAFVPVKKELSVLSETSAKLSGEFSRELFILQQEARTMQLLPVDHLLLPLKRTVREMAEAAGKQVELVIEGERVEIDKSILEVLKAPLQHVIRNTLAHGIENEGRRKELKKPVLAKLLIQVSSEAGHIKLVLSDDGQGIDVAKLKQRALEQNIQTREELDALTEQQALELIFRSGLSTADTVSELSGRGVGLDAVWSDIKRARGDITVASVWGEGCQFTLTLPLALASSRGLFVRLQASTFMLPTVSLNALYDVRRDLLKRINNQWAMVIHEAPVAVFSLSELLGLGKHVFNRAMRYDGILIGTHQQQIIILVDEIIEEHDCVVKPLPFSLNQLKHVTGVTLIETGALVLALNVEALVNKALSSQTMALDLSENKVGSEAEIIKRIRVLVVEDSLTVRTLAVNGLCAAGYEVTDAEDGQKAWDLLQDTMFDCVVTDIEMPLMDGFELTQAIKADEKLAQTPVVIVSSRETPEYKQRGMEVGASAYLVKKEFDTRTLIDMVASLL